MAAVAPALAALSVMTLRERDLPTELTDAIIDHLHDDKPSLQNCALVSSAWLESSRYHLFYAVRVRGELPGRSFAEFLAFLAAAPHIRDTIRELTFRVNGKIAAHPPATRCVGPHILATVLKTLPALRALALDNVSWDRNLIAGGDGRTVAAWPPAPRALGVLTLSRVVTEEFLAARIFRLNDAFEVLFAFAPLGTLRLLSMTLELNLRGPALPAFPPALRLGAYTVHANYARIPPAPVLDAIHATMARSLRAVDFAVRSDEEAAVLGNLLRVVGGTLEALALDMSDMTVLRAFNAPGPWHALHLPTLGALRALELHVWSSGAHVRGDLFTYDGQWCVCSVAPLLAYLPARAPLARVRLVVHVAGYAHALRAHLADGVDWAVLLHELQRFPTLGAVAVEVRPRRGQHVRGDALDAVADLLESRLAPLVDAGVMTVEVTEDVAPPARGER
ncbi:hypothetical protein PsYK624_140840 [Phanerochaete sordida]|uniref:F-box domain-containing protein n=1 Tax=Phanerochaete sordida TaxID=48140 RepID=A0A9P3GM27_9APHY|nr:hypothetical protein PsYK624_140840 [Phanerochaete sordida]